MATSTTRKGIVSELIKVTHDLELKWGNFRLFRSRYYFDDPKNQDGDRPHTPLSDAAKHRSAATPVLLDNYLTGKFEIGSMPLTLRRAGRSSAGVRAPSFPTASTSSTRSSVRLRSPGAELREALLPVYAIDATMSVTDKLSIEAVRPARIPLRPDRSGRHLFQHQRFCQPRRQKRLPRLRRAPDSGTLGGIRAARITAPATTDSGASPCTIWRAA